MRLMLVISDKRTGKKVKCVYLKTDYAFADDSSLARHIFCHHSFLEVFSFYINNLLISSGQELMIQKASSLSFTSTLIHFSTTLIDEDEPILEKAIGTKIEWLPRKCVTRKGV